MKKYIFIIFTFIVFTLYVLTIRGDVGVPTPYQIEFQQNSNGKPFESSQERSRYAIVLSLSDYKSVNIDHYASMGTPDIGRIHNHYYSLFPIGASIIALPFYQLGLLFNAAQMFTFSVSTVFAILTMIVIVLYTRKLGLHWSISLFSSLAFGFATNAWGYSVTLYAHLISAFLITTALYLTSFIEEKREFLNILIVWLLYSLAVFIDFPNLFIFLPIVIVLSLRFFDIKKSNGYVKISLKLKYLIGPLIFIPLMILYGYYNQINFGSMTTLSNAIPRVQDLKIVKKSVPETGKDATGALKTRNLLEGLRSFSISSDRGILIYSPVVLLSIFGIGYFKEKKKRIHETLLIGVPLVCLTVYSMFGDPYGGWAFGSRYMIAVLPALAIMSGVALHRFSRNIWIKILFTVVFIYSTAVSLLAPLTTNVIPPLVEAQGTGLRSDYSINIQMLNHNQLNSYFYNHILNGQISGITYYLIVLTIVLVAGITVLWWPKGGKGEANV